MKNYYILKEVVEWDILNWSIALNFWLKHSSKNLTDPIKALEIGSRNGGLSLWMALNGVNCICSDLNGPTEKAIKKHFDFGVSKKITYQKINALSINIQEQVDIILFKSVLGGIGANDNYENQVKAIQEIYECLKIGGELWFAENLIASPLHQLLRNKYIKWGKTWRYVTIKEMETLLTSFQHIDLATVGFLGAFGQTATQKNILGVVDRFGFAKLVPASWRYIIIGVAKKTVD